MLLLLYDELKWRGLRKIKESAIEELRARRRVWWVPWRSIRKAKWEGSTLVTSTAERLRTPIAFEESDAAAVDGALAALRVPVVRTPATRPSRVLGNFAALFVILFVASQAILVSAAVLPFFPGEEQLYSSTLNQIQGQLSNNTLLQQFELIYRNNLQIASANMLPGLGVLSFGAASYNTGRVIQVIGLEKHVSPVLFILSLYVYPHSWVEELSYPLATAAGIMMLTRWRRPLPISGRRSSRGSVKFTVALLGVAAQLTIAGFFEVVEPGLGASAFLLWVPVALGVVALAFLALRARPRREVEMANQV